MYQTIASAREIKSYDHVLIENERWRVFWPADYASHESVQFLAIDEAGNKKVFTMRNDEMIIILKK